MRLRRPPLRPATRLRLSSHTVRSRLTVVYGALFLASGAVLLVVAGVLWGRATSSPITVSGNVRARILSIPGLFQISTPGGARGLLGVVKPANWVNASVPSLSQPPSLLARARVPSPLPKNVVRQLGQVTAQVKYVAAGQHTSDLHQLLLYSGIALALMAILSIALGWLVAGRVLRPLHTITLAARDISATNLHERLALDGPHDELRELGDTFDQLLERLDRSFKSQRQFVANASHELRTPLATMRASLDVALAKPEPVPDQTVALADRIGRELDQVDRLLEGFLALARAQRGPAEEDEQIALDLLVAAAFERRATDVADVALEVRQGSCASAWVNGNETLLARMVENLVDNAVRHNERGGWVEVAVNVEATTVILAVENGGQVLDEPAVQELAQPFHRLGAERTGSDAGFGLGLSIVAAVAEAHGGRLELHARDSGGLRAVVELPLAVRTFAGLAT